MSVLERIGRWLSPASRPSCCRCDREDFLIEGDGPTVCRVCVFAWGGLGAAVRTGSVVPEVGGLQLRHAAHETPLLACPLCRAGRRDRLASLDGSARDRFR